MEMQLEKENAAPIEEPVKKKPRLSLSLKSRRFKESVSDNLTELTKPIVPKNTAKNTMWALKNFMDWRAEREQHHPLEVCPPDILEKTLYNAEELNKWLCLYILETRRADGQPYPLTTIYHLLSGILRHMRSRDHECPNFLDKKNHHFQQLSSALENMGKQLRCQGIGAEVKHASLITSEEEELLWTSHILSTKDPKSLLYAVFYCNGKNFCLRGGNEHRNLKLSQLKCMYDPDRYIYIENGSKNRSGAECTVENKTVPIFSCFDQVGERCHVFLLDSYISKMPQKAKDLDYFYLRPLDYVPSNPTAVWYCNSPVGEHKLAGMVKEMFEKIGIAGKTNHSLRATGASALFEANVPEKLIQERTGHRSIKALRLYERTTDKQHEEVSMILAKRDEEQKYGKQQEKMSASEVTSTSMPFPTFGTLKHCTININYGTSGPSTVNMQTQSHED
uniref:Uncharacterized protein n=1 Tax=Amphimedon queenslandica TaxID=400682 RepID=A0A1X7U4V1_AMPQE